MSIGVIASVSGGAALLDGAIIDSAPEFYYRLVETSGTDLFDSSGNGHDEPGGYVAGYTLNQPGLDNSAPSDPAVDLTDGPNVEVGYGAWMDGWNDISLFAIIRPDANTPTYGNIVVARDNNGSHGPWNLRLKPTGELAFYFAWTGSFPFLTPHVIEGVTRLVPSVKYTVGVSYENATGDWKIYLNGQVDASGTTASGLGPAGFSDGSQRLTIGGWNFSPGGLDGRIGKVAGWSRVVSEAEMENFDLLAGHDTVATLYPGACSLGITSDPLLTGVVGSPPQLADGSDATYVYVEDDGLGSISQIVAPIDVLAVDPGSVTEIEVFVRAKVTTSGTTFGNVFLYSPLNSLLTGAGGTAPIAQDGIIHSFHYALSDFGGSILADAATVLADPNAELSLEPSGQGVVDWYEIRFVVTYEV